MYGANTTIPKIIATTPNTIEVEENLFRHIIQNPESVK